MAKTALTLQVTDREGLEATYANANADGQAFDNASGKVILHVKNGSASPVTVTIGSAGSLDGRTVAALSVAVPAGEDRFIGPFPGALYNAADNTLNIDEAVSISFSAATDVTVAAIKLGSLAY